MRPIFRFTIGKHLASNLELYSIVIDDTGLSIVYFFRSI